MLRKLRLLLLLAAIVTAPALAQTRVEWRSEPPVTYVLDYGARHLGNPEWLDATAAAPPTFLHLGKDVPMSHNWGPIAGLGGENQAGGKGEAIRRLPPDEVAERIGGLRAMVAALRDAGVDMVMPYICSMTIAGHAEERTGLWEFYDHWADYERFGIGPRPQLDVTDWLQRDESGEPIRFYRYTGDFYPPYEPNHRYAACMNNPGWQQWLYAVTRLLAECGYDGCFVDNGGSHKCYCHFCQDLFREFLTERYTAAQLKDLMGFENPGDIRLGVKGGGFLWAETQRFWIETVRRHQVAIKKAGEAVEPGFRVFPNGGHHRPEFVKLAYPDSDYIMFEKSVGDYGTNPGMARYKVIETIAVKKYNDNVYEYKLTAATRSKVKTIILTRGGYPRTDPALDMNHSIACLGMAEAAAFGSGAGFLIRPSYDEFGEALRLYRGFFEDHADLYTGYVPCAQVGVLHFPEQKLLDNTVHNAQVERLTRALLDDHILFEYLLEEDLEAERLEGLSAVIMPAITHLSAQQDRALEAWVRAGGKLMVTDPLPAFDLQMRPREAPWLEVARDELVAVGDGAVLRKATASRRDADEDLEKLTGARLPVLAGAGGKCPTSVRVNAWRGAADGTHRYVFHLLNYATPLGADAPPPEPVVGIELRLPADVPATAEIAAWQPGRDEPLAVSSKVVDGIVSLSLPEFTVYEVITVD